MPPSSKTTPKTRGPKFRFIDLFAGVGGIRIPFEELGGKCVFTSEIDERAAATYEVNFGEKPTGDIRAVDEKDIPDHDLLVGGFPCQPFSHAGLKEGFNDDTRGTLFFEIERILGYHEPTAILLENVKGLVSHDKGNTMRVIEQHLDDLGYWVHAMVLNAKDFGLPQNRERIFIVGLNKERIDARAFQFPEPLMTPTRLGDILEDDVDPKFTISNKLWAGHQRRRREHAARGNGFGYSIFTEDSEYTSTISARYYKDGSEILIADPSDPTGIHLNPRKLTPREAARLQGFPEDFIVNPSNSQAYKQFGNAVAIPVIRAIAAQLVPLIVKHRQRN